MTEISSEIEKSLKHSSYLSSIISIVGLLAAMIGISFSLFGVFSNHGVPTNTKTNEITEISTDQQDNKEIKLIIEQNKNLEAKINYLENEIHIIKSANINNNKAAHITK